MRTRKETKLWTLDSTWENKDCKKASTVNSGRVTNEKEQVGLTACVYGELDSSTPGSQATLFLLLGGNIYRLPRKSEQQSRRLWRTQAQLSMWRERY